MEMPVHAELSPSRSKFLDNRKIQIGRIKYFPENECTKNETLFLLIILSTEWVVFSTPNVLSPFTHGLHAHCPDTLSTNTVSTDSNS